MRVDIRQKLNNKAPVKTLKSAKSAMSLDSSEWNDMVFVSQTQVIEELDTETLTHPKTRAAMLMANFTKILNFALRKRQHGEATTPERTSKSVKEETHSPGVPKEEFRGEYQGFFPEGMLVNVTHRARSFVVGFYDMFVEGLKGLKDPKVNQLFQGRHRCSSSGIKTLLGIHKYGSRRERNFEKGSIHGTIRTLLRRLQSSQNHILSHERNTTSRSLPLYYRARSRNCSTTKKWLQLLGTLISLLG